MAARRWRRRVGLSLSAAWRAVPARPGRRILAYHAVGHDVRDDFYGFTIAAADFAHHVDALTAAHQLQVVTLTSEIGEGETTVALTFDDGYAGVLEIAAPLLARHAMPFTVFVTTGFLEQPGFLSRRALRELATVPGATLGFHGRSHARLTGMSASELAAEVADGRRELEDLIGGAVTAMSYPHGAVDRRVRDAVAGAGFAHAATSRYGANRVGADRLMLRRCEVVSEDTAAVVLAKATGAWDWLGVRPNAR